MPVYNVCSKCGRKIEIRKPADPYLQKTLKDSKTAVCNVCDPASAWVRVGLEEVFSDKGYNINGTIIQASGGAEFPTITIRWKDGKTTFLSAREVNEKIWRKSTFPSYVKETLDRIHSEFILQRK